MWRSLTPGLADAVEVLERLQRERSESAARPIEWKAYARACGALRARLEEVSLTERAAREVTLLQPVKHAPSCMCRDCKTARRQRSATW